MHQHIAFSALRYFLFLFPQTRTASGFAINGTSPNLALERREIFQGGTSLSANCCPAGTTPCNKNFGSTCCPNTSVCDVFGKACCAGSTNNCAQMVQSLNRCADLSWVPGLFEPHNICCPPGFDPQPGSSMGGASFCKQTANSIDTCASSQPGSNSPAASNNNVNDQPQPAPAQPPPPQLSSSLLTTMTPRTSQSPSSVGPLIPLSSGQLFGSSTPGASPAFTASSSASSAFTRPRPSSSELVKVPTVIDKDNTIQTATPPSIPATNTPTSLPTHNIQPGAIAGIILGSLTGAGLLIAACAMVLLRWKQSIYTKAKEEVIANMDHINKIDSQFGISEFDGDHAFTHEVDGRQSDARRFIRVDARRFVTPEMNGDMSPRELPGVTRI